MPTAGRLIIILLIFGAAAHIFLGGGLSFINDYHIWRPIVETSRQEIILVHDINNNDRISQKTPSDELINRTESDNRVNILPVIYKSVSSGLLIGKPTSLYPISDKFIASDSGNIKPLNMSTKSVHFSNAVWNIYNTTFTTVTAINSIRHLFNDTSKCATVPGSQMISQNQSLTSCPIIPPGLVGRIKVWYDKPTFEEIEQLYPYLEPGGHGKPKNCLSRHKVAIIVPYRDREVHLRILLHNLHSLLTKQQLDYAIFVIEQHENETFNRAKLMNVGYVEAMKLYDWQCFVFHDVDLLAEDDRNIYSCPDQPRHMSVAVNKFKYKLPYGSIFGGVCAIRAEQFLTMNGFSNSYWGWGGEDDDLSTRVTSVGYKIMRYPTEIARYQMIKHKSEMKNPINRCRYDLLAKTKMRQQTDGISSLKYECYDLHFLPLFTHIKVKLLEHESKIELRNEGFKKC
uniref:Beta-1,4-N-acetylgalactosaminyltransferase n=1 Tax=Setaria digitata TaxID=48799 RepID=A0A915Q2Y6_9BILA